MKPIRITPREADVLAWMAEGMTMHETADALGIAYETVRCLLRRVYNRLGMAGEMRPNAHRAIALYASGRLVTTPEVPHALPPHLSRVVAQGWRRG